MNEEEFFDYCLRSVLAWETAEYTNDPDDPGGPTKYGITQKTLAAYRNQKVTAEAVRNLTYTEAKHIYRRNFWNQYNCNLLPRPLALLLFDACVNQPGHVMCEYMQQAIGGITVDGNIGPKTAQAAAKGNIKEIAINFMSYRAIRYASKSTFAKYGRGLMRRMFDMQTRFAELSTLN